jgi:hypothetical protein
MKSMKKSNHEIGSWLILFLGFYTLVIAILWIFVTEIMFVSDFAHVTGYQFSEHPDTVLAGFYILTKRLIGVMILVVALLILLINQKAYRKGEKWSWFAILIAGGVTWGTFIVYKIIIGYIGASMITFVIGTLITLIGLILSAKEMLGKN